MTEYSEYQQNYETPWGIPKDVFWDHSEGANIRRAQWVLDNALGVTFQELQYGLVMQPGDEELLSFPADY